MNSTYFWFNSFRIHCEVSDYITQDLMNECPTDEKLVKYYDYLVENYISEDSVFSPTLWACIQRVNNSSQQMRANRFTRISIKTFILTLQQS